MSEDLNKLARLHVLRQRITDATTMLLARGEGTETLLREILATLKVNRCRNLLVGVDSEATRVFDTLLAGWEKRLKELERESQAEDRGYCAAVATLADGGVCDAPARGEDRATRGGAPGRPAGRGSVEQDGGGPDRTRRGE